MSLASISDGIASEVPRGMSEEEWDTRRSGCLTDPQNAWGGPWFWIAWIEGVTWRHFL